MRTHLENIIQRLTDLKKDLERELPDPRASLERELLQSIPGEEAAPGQIPERWQYASGDRGHLYHTGGASVPYAAQNPANGYHGADYGGPAHSPEERTAVLINHGRRSVYHRRFSSYARKVAVGTAVIAFLVTILVMIMSRGGASWPSSVATVQSEISKACQNPDVMSEPGQVNFACGKTTRQILWVFALMTSDNNSNFADAETGRLGLEPITPAQGGQLASSLNLHHPYSPTNPIDSIEVAARAINDIIGGATLTDANGNPVVQAGLESQPANCLRYTGSAAIISHVGYPDLCAKPASSPAGQAALVADVYRKWIVGASAKVAQDVAVLFENAKNPSDPRVQSILQHLPHSTLSG
jgi:hypothetical protein